MACSKAAGPGTYTCSANPELETSMTLNTNFPMDHMCSGEERCGSSSQSALHTIHEKHCVEKNIKLAKFTTLEEYLNKPLPLEDYLNKPLPPTPNQPSVDLSRVASQYGEILWADADADARDLVKTVYEQSHVQPSNGDFQSQAPTYPSLRNLRDSEQLPNYALHGLVDPLNEQSIPKKRAVLSPESTKPKLRSADHAFLTNSADLYGSHNPSKYVVSNVDSFEIYFVQTERLKRKAPSPIETKSFIGFSDSNVFACSPVPFKQLRDDRQDAMEVVLSQTTASLDLLPPLAPVPARLPSIHTMAPAPVPIDQTLAPARPTVQAMGPARLPSIHTMAPAQVPVGQTMVPLLPIIGPGTVDPDSPYQNEFLRPRGWPGQFESYEVGHINRRAAQATSPETHIFGNPDHPNGEFTHINFWVDPIEHKDYDQERLKSVRVRKVAFSHADYETDNALEMERSAAEEALRRQACRECAAARLEGVSVGHHRYYAGKMSLGEYMMHKMCICWDDCWCNKLCTIYADVVCPCHRFILL